MANMRSRKHRYTDRKKTEKTRAVRTKKRDRVFLLVKGDGEIQTERQLDIKTEKQRGRNKEILGDRKTE